MNHRHLKTLSFLPLITTAIGHRCHRCHPPSPSCWHAVPIGDVLRLEDLVFIFWGAASERGAWESGARTSDRRRLADEFGPESRCYRKQGRWNDTLDSLDGMAPVKTIF